MRIAWILCATLCFGTSAGAQTARDTGQVRPTGTATISGVVRSADESNAPVRLARVTLNSVDRAGAADTVTTDAAGRFTFRGLPAGRYSLQASKRAWLDANYGAVRPGRAGTPIAVASGETTGGLTIRMTRGAVIAGVVRDPSGEPQPGIQVRVMRFVTRDGMRALERSAAANANDPITDDEGAYRVFGLPPGDYLVVGALRFSDSGGLGGVELRQLDAPEIDRALAGSPPTGASTASGGITNAPVFFPGTPDMASASTVTLAAGEEKRGIDIPFAMYPTARVTGSLAFPGAAVGEPSAPGERSTRGELRITPAGFEDLMLQPLAASVADVGPDGRFAFTGIPPGHYTITAVIGRPGGGSASSSSGPTVAGWAFTSVVVSGQDQDISITLVPGTGVQGRVAFEGDAPPKDPTAEVQVQARGFGRARFLRANLDARPMADGTFRFPAIVGGRWKFQTSLPVSSRWSLKSITLGGRELDDFLDVDGGGAIPELVLTFTDRPSELGGSLQDASGRPASDYFVIAFSADRASWTPVSRRIQSTRPASDGAFSIKGLPAGEYYLAALTDVEPNEWLAPQFLEQIVASSVRVRVTDAAKTVQNLRIAK